MNSRLAQWLSWSLYATGLGLLGLAVYYYFAPPQGPKVAAADTDVEVAGLFPGRKSEVILRVVNHAAHPVRFLGMADC
jgi:hypothetical protein